MITNHSICLCIYIQPKIKCIYIYVFNPYASSIYIYIYIYILCVIYIRKIHLIWWTHPVVGFSVLLIWIYAIIFIGRRQHKDNTMPIYEIFSTRNIRSDLDLDCLKHNIFVHMFTIEIKLKFCNYQNNLSFFIKYSWKVHQSFHFMKM